MDSVAPLTSDSEEEYEILSESEEAQPQEPNERSSPEPPMPAQNSQTSSTHMESDEAISRPGLRRQRPSDGSSSNGEDSGSQLKRPKLDGDNKAPSKRINEIDDHIRALLNERKTVIRTLSVFENFTTGPDIHGLTQLVQMDGPVLSIKAPLLKSEGYYSGAREQGYRSDANMERNKYLRAIDLLAGLESNLGDQQLPEQWGYHVKFKIEHWRSTARQSFTRVYQALAREIECRYARVYEKRPLDERAAELQGMCEDDPDLYPDHIERHWWKNSVGGSSSRTINQRDFDELDPEDQVNRGLFGYGVTTIGAQAPDSPPAPQSSNNNDNANDTTATIIGESATEQPTTGQPLAQQAEQALEATQTHTRSKTPSTDGFANHLNQTTKNSDNPPTCQKQPRPGNFGIDLGDGARCLGIFPFPSRFQPPTKAARSAHDDSQQGFPEAQNGHDAPAGVNGSHASLFNDPDNPDLWAAVRNDGGALNADNGDLTNLQRHPSGNKPVQQPSILAQENQTPAQQLPAAEQSHEHQLAQSAQAPTPNNGHDLASDITMTNPIVLIEARTAERSDPMRGRGNASRRGRGKGAGRGRGWGGIRKKH